MLAGQRPSPAVEETRSRILAAARELFERYGTRGTTTREVAERAGVNEATLFRHFGSKRGLLDAMRDAAADPQGFISVLAALPASDLRADLRIIAQLAVDSLRAKRALLCVSLAESASGDDDAPEWRGPSETVCALTAYFAVHAAAGRLRTAPAIAARTFLGLFFSLIVSNKLWDGVADDPATIDALIDLFINGVTQ